MSTRQSEDPIDIEILSLSGGILDGICRIGNGGPPVDMEVLSLRGALFDTLPAEGAPGAMSLGGRGRTS